MTAGVRLLFNGFVCLCSPDIWEPELEARGGHPAERDTHPAPLLLPLLGTLHQHRAHSAALQAGPRCVQVRQGWGQGLYLSLQVTEARQSHQDKLKLVLASPSQAMIPSISGLCNLDTLLILTSRVESLCGIALMNVFASEWQSVAC